MNTEEEKKKEEKQKNLIRWQSNESLLQSYRSIFITSQSVLLAAVIFVIDKHPCVGIGIITIAVLQLYLGFTLIIARAKVVDFYKEDLSCKYNENGDSINKKAGNSLKEYIYVHNRKVRDKVNKEIFKEKTDCYYEKFIAAKWGSNWRRTRIKTDIFIPFSFFVIWIILLIVCVSHIVSCEC